MRRLSITAALGAVLTLFLAAHASASSTMRTGIQDDAWLRWGPGTLDARLEKLDGLGVKLVRFTVVWSEAAPTKPATPRDPDDPAYDWSQFDTVLDGLRSHGMTALVTLWGAPKWSNGGRKPNWLPKSGFGDFAYAAAKRYPWVHLWTVWNEPNTAVFSRPVSPKLYVRRLLNPAYALLHRASRRNIVAGGVTSPRKTASGMSPSTFMTGMRAAHAKLDAYGANPYPSTARETPFTDPCSWCKTLTMAHLPEIRRLVTKLFGKKKPLWLTEYGVQTNPPDRLSGVSWARQATNIGQAALRVWEQPGATILIQFLVQDEPSIGGWQSGLYTSRGKAKPARQAFAVPFAQLSRRGTRTVLWGQIHPGSGRRPFVVQRWTGHRWANVGSLRRTSPGGTLKVVLSAKHGTKVRIRPTRLGFTSTPVVIS
jgi:hypothetical protein